MLRIKHIQLFAGAIFILLLNSCTKSQDEKPANETGTMTDIENRVYKTVKIGNQWWMTEDLKTTKYRNGYSVPLVTDSLAWSTDTTGVCNEIKSNQLTIGRVYNWYAIHNTNNIAPAGWHIPSDEEWKELEKNLGMSASEADKSGWRGAHEGEKLKIQGPQSWTEHAGVWGTNESGFTAIALGCVLFNSEPAEPGMGATAFWWSSTAHDDNNAYYRYLDYKNTNIFRSQCSKNYGYSVRCVKD